MPAKSVPVSTKGVAGKAALLGGLLFLPFLLGYFFPDTWWGSHFVAFLPGNWGVFFLLLAGFFFSLPLWNAPNKASRIPWPLKRKDWAAHKAALAAAIIFGVLCFFFPLHFDYFGDAPTFLAAFDQPDKNVNHWQMLLSPNIFHLRVGERTVLNLAAVLVDALGCSPQEAFRLIGGASAALYAYVTVRAVFRHLKTSAARLLMVIAFLIAPSTFVFMGHVEVYAPLWPVIALFCSQVLSYFQDQKLNRLLWMLPVIFLALKLHLSSVLLLPVWALLLVYFLLKEKEGFRKRLNWRWMGLVVILPLFVGAMVVYFGVLGDHRDPRFLGEGIKGIDRLFLPLFSPDPPLDRYNLLGREHLLDFVNVLLLWSPLGLTVLLAGFTFLRKAVPWNKPEIMALGLLLLMYAGLLFMVNPLLGMPLDQDLMSIPAPILAFFAMLVLRETESDALWKSLAGPALGVVVLVLPMLYVHSDPAPLSLRLESMGRHTFRTYWIRSAGDIQAGLSLVKVGKPSVYEERYLANLNAIEPDAVPGNDLEYAVLAANLGKYYRKERKDFAQAQKYHDLASRYYPDLGFNLIGLVECAFFSKDYRSSLHDCDRLIRLNYPDPQKALAIGIEMALRAGDMDRTRRWVEQYLQMNPRNPDFQRLRDGLGKGLGQEELLKVFE